MFKKPFIAVAFAIAALSAFGDATIPNNADLTIEIRDLTDPDYLLPTQVMVISEKDIIQGGFTSVTEILESYSNFRATTDSTGARRSTAIDLRGFGETAARNVMILLDGVPLNNPTLEAPNLGLLPITSIRQIELIPSGAGVLYGNGAVGGVIRIVTKNDAQELRPIFSATVGSWGYANTSATSTLILDQSTLTGEATRQSSDGYRHFNDSDLSHGKLTFKMNRDFDFAFSHSRSLDQRRAAGASLPSVIEVNRKDSSINDRSSVNFREAITVLSFGQQVRTTKARIHMSHRQSNQHGSYENPTYGDIAQNLDVLSLKTELSSGGDSSNDKWLTGLELGNGRYSSLYISPHRKQTQAAVYGQRSATLNDKTEINMGARYQWVKDTMATNYDAENSLTAVDVSVSKLLGKVSVNARIEQNFRYATLDEQSTSGNALTPQIGQGFEVSAEYLGGSISWWTLQNKDEILFDANDTSQTGFGSNINVEETSRTGVTANFKARVSDASTLQTQVSYVDTLIKAGSFAGSMIPGVSPWQANLTLKTNWNDRFQSQMSHRWYSSAYAITDYENDLGRHNSYTTTSLSTTYQQNNWLLSFGINNLFDVDRDAYVYDSYGTLKRSPAEPRSFMLTYRYFPE